ncbi:LysR family transcriptional regulator [Streptantibioticus cattleyicolor]|uniref:LysR family transcriptional regulator n=1 Tax=Streptantibioticus cattleyicolor (strain ATCC 35852 / DSM 46488 / JCM 4925 / NBRC 14057 / NRRL 8057) TaxID=1003195 RepID=G8WVX5_STREN|nr:LysR family transcriptional regulator [Streptantibioticus cattleyicolor]AEW93068.1 LysR family transcriptional regulator [Streptantibioticus cattleyicolor NRRL 8057 = DSM 46488]
MLSLERLRVLHAIDTYGSVSGAAEALRVTTSAISQQMGKLEKETGQQMLVKSGRGVRLTDAARLLSGHAERILSMVELAHSELEAHRGAAVGTLAIGTFATAARGLFPAAFAALRADHPRLRPHLREMEPSESVPGLMRGDIDLAVVLDWYNKPLPRPEGLAKAELLDDVVDVAVPSGHRLAGRAEVDLDDFADDDWIAWPAGEFCHESLLFTMRGKGIEPRIAHFAGEHQTQLAFVAAGLGVAVTPRLGRGPVPEGVRVIPVRHTLHRHVYAIWRTDADRRPAVRAMVAALRAAGRR